VELTKYHVAGKKIVTTPAPNWRGLQVDYPNFQLLGLGLAMGDAKSEQIDPDGCVVISEVKKDSPAAQNGLEPEMAITHVGKTRVRSPKQFYAAVADKTGPVELRLVVPKDQKPWRTIPAESAGDDSSS
jgi:serine protease Do